MKKILTIEGMTCGHCAARVEKALNTLPGVKAKVNLSKKQAAVSGDATAEQLTKAVEDAGYKVTSVLEKKGLFG